MSEFRTRWQLAAGVDVEIPNLLDDHSRFCLASLAFQTIKALHVLETFDSAAESYGYRPKFLSENAAVFSGAPRKGRVELDRLGIESKHWRPCSAPMRVGFGRRSFRRGEVARGRLPP